MSPIKTTCPICLRQDVGTVAPPFIAGRDRHKMLKVRYHKFAGKQCLGTGEPVLVPGV